MPELIEDFARRAAASVQQTLFSAGEWRVHPLLGRRSLICPSRSLRRSEAPRRDVQRIETSPGQCHFCQGRTPSTLFFIDRRGEVVVPTESGSIEAAREFLVGKDRERIETFHRLTEHLRPYNHATTDYLVRTFLNLTPIVAAEDEACFVTAVDPRYHANDFVDTPTPVLAGVIRSWEFIERWAAGRGLTVVPFINAGKRRESGQTVACVHGQTHALRDLPPRLQRVRKILEQARECPVCQLAQEQHLRLWVHPSGSVTLHADPAPVHCWSLLVLAGRHEPGITALGTEHFAEAVLRAVRAWRGMFGAEPAFNLLVYSGRAVCHAFAELVPRTETNVLAGRELLTGEPVIDVPPERVREELGHRVL